VQLRVPLQARNRIRHQDPASVLPVAFVAIPKNNFDRE